MNNRLKEVLPSDDLLSKCIHCGMCLAVCPTYDITKLERSSPRGRIKMIKSVADGEMEMSSLFAKEMYFCLDCQACETACPAGVKYGLMAEAARSEADKAKLTPAKTRFIKRAALKYVVANKLILRLSARILFFYQNSFLRKFLHHSKVIKNLFADLLEADKLSPMVSRKFSSGELQEHILPEGEVKYKTAFLTGCLMDVMFADINKDTIDVLKYLGCAVYVPLNQVCCGSLHAHNGDPETAEKLARKNIDAFSGSEYDFLISNSAGCGAFMKEYGRLFKDDPVYAEKGKVFAEKVKDITEFLYMTGIPETVIEETEKITYHEACHLVHSQKISVQPKALLTKIAGSKFVPLNEAAWCCGSAGIYNLTNYNDSMKLLKKKMENIKSTKADVVLTANPGCIQQIKYGADKFNIKIKVKHPATYFKEYLLKLKTTLPPKPPVHK